MKRILFFLSMLLLINASASEAAYVKFEFDYPKNANLMGWNIYHVNAIENAVPDGEYILANYENMVHCQAFSGEDLLIPAVDREWGCRVLPSPGNEDSQWRVAIFSYFPQTNPKANMRLYFIATALGLDGYESGPSNVVSVESESPDKPGTPGLIE